MDEQLFQQVQGWVKNHRNDIVKDIKDIVNIKSVSEQNSLFPPFGKGCREVLDAMLEKGVKKGFSVQNYENYCGSIAAQKKTNADVIGVWCHLDVVPEGDNWIYEPYRTAEKNGFLIGRGVQDNKSPAVAMLYVLQCIKELNIPFRHNIKLYIGCSEECGMQDLDYFISHYSAPKLSLVADCGFPVCHGEKGILAVELNAGRPVSKGILRFSGGVSGNTVPDTASITLKNTPRIAQAVQGLNDGFQVVKTENSVTITAFGVSKHCAFPEGSVNAVYKLTHTICKLGVLSPKDAELVSFLNIVNRDYYGTGLGIACEDNIFGKLTCAGTLVSLKDRKISLHVNIRYPLCADAKECLDKIEQACLRNGFTLSVKENLKAIYHSADSEVVQTLTGVYNQIRGEKSSPFTMSGGSYCRKLPNAVAFGMALPNKDVSGGGMFPAGHGDYHQPDEAMNIGQLLEAISIYVMALAEVDRLELKV